MLERLKKLFGFAKNVSQTMEMKVDRSNKVSNEANRPKQAHNTARKPKN